MRKKKLATFRTELEKCQWLEENDLFLKAPRDQRVFGRDPSNFPVDLRPSFPRNLLQLLFVNVSASFHPLVASKSRRKRKKNKPNFLADAISPSRSAHKLIARQLKEREKHSETITREIQVLIHSADTFFSSFPYP